MKLYGVCLTALLLACGARTPLECPSGAEGCDCDPYGNCEPGLVCQTGVCAPSSVVSTGGSGGQRSYPPSDTGGAFSLGGIGAGGALGAGGIVGTGGAVRTGGTVGTGGLVRTGGSPGTGGAIAAGGRIVATGGRSSGGDGAGVTGSGGLGRGGMSGGAAGSTVTFANGRAEGAMTGWGWVALGQLDTLSAPTCGGKPVTSSSACGAFEWPSRSGLCMSGSIPAVSGGDYSANWGIMLAANVAEPKGTGLGQSFQSITFNLQGSPTSSLRGMVHRKGDGEATNYCANIASGVAVPVTSFSTSCWDGSGKSLVVTDVPDLDWIGIQVVSGTSPVTVSNLCLTSLVFK